MVISVSSNSSLSMAAALLLSAAGAAVTAQPASTAGRLEGWRADLDLFSTELPRLHANAFHHISRRTFSAEVGKLRRRLPTINADQFWVGLDQIESDIGDGHTFMHMPVDAPRFGLDFKQFGNGYRVVAVAPGIRSDGILGSRLVAIDRVELSKVREQILTLTPQDELRSLRDFRSQALLSNGLVLHGLGIAGERDTATYQFEDDAGRQASLVLHSAALAPRDTWTTVQTHPAEQTGDQRLRCSSVGGGGTTLCEFRSYDDLEHTSARLFDAVRQNRSQRLIIDMRENGGGNFCKGLQYLVDPIAGDRVINRSGGLYVLIGQQTFSAAMSNAAHFRQMTHATLVGQPIGEKPNSYQEIEDLRLPYTGWDARYSSRFYKFGDGPENIIRPDVDVASSWSDYRQGRDPALAYILSRPMNETTAQPASTPSRRPAGEEYCKGS